MKQLGEDLECMRKVRKMTQAEVAERIGSSRPTIARIEAGDAGVSIGTIIRMAEIYGVPELIRDAFSSEKDPEVIRRSRLNAAQTRRVSKDDPFTGTNFDF